MRVNLGEPLEICALEVNARDLSFVFTPQKVFGPSKLKTLPKHLLRRYLELYRVYNARFFPLFSHILTLATYPLVAGSRLLPSYSQNQVHRGGALTRSQHAQHTRGCSMPRWKLNKYNTYSWTMWTVGSSWRYLVTEDVGFENAQALKIVSLNVPGCGHAWTMGGILPRGCPAIKLCRPTSFPHARV